MPATTRSRAGRARQPTQTDALTSSPVSPSPQNDAGLPDRDAFEASVDEYLASLHPTKQRKALRASALASSHRRPLTEPQTAAQLTVTSTTSFSSSS